MVNLSTDPASSSVPGHADLGTGQVMCKPVSVEVSQNVNQDQGSTVSQTAFKHYLKSYLTRLNEPLNVWHSRFGHLNTLSIRKTLEGGGIELNDTKAKLDCHACKLGKAQHRPAPPLSLNKPTKPLQVVSIDTSGQIKVASFGGAKYFSVATDLYSMHVKTFTHKLKSQLSNLLINWFPMASKQTGHSLVHVRRDNAGEYKGFSAWCTAEHVNELLNVPEYHAQNGPAEDIIKNVRRCARTAMLDAHAPQGLWAEAIHYAGFVWNNSAHKRIGWSTPMELFFKQLPRWYLLRPFGCAAYALLKDASRSKWAAQAQLCAYLRPADQEKGFRLWVPQQNKVIIAAHVDFSEGYMPWRDGWRLPGRIQERKENSNLFEYLSKPQEEESSESDEERAKQPPRLPHLAPPAVPGPALAEEVEPPQAPEEKGEERENRDLQEANDLAPDAQEVAAPAPVFAAPRYSLRDNRGVPPDRLDPSIKAIKSNLKEEEVVPRSHEQAMTSNHAKEWQAAEETELNTWREMHAYEPLNSKPQEAVAHNLMWVFALKRDAAGSVVARKARLVVRGDQMLSGTDYEELSADVAATRSFRLLLALAAAYGWSLSQLDVRGAFLYASLKQPMLVNAPPGCGSAWWRVTAAAYGRPDAPALWREHLHKTLVGIGFTACTADGCLYHSSKEQSKAQESQNENKTQEKESKEQVGVLLAVHVDDILLTGPNKQAMMQVVKQMSKAYKLKVDNTPTWLLKMRLQQTSKKIKLDQSAFAQAIVQRFNAEEQRKGTSRLPLPAGSFIEPPNEEDELLNEQQARTFRALVGSLNYLATHTRPDLAFATQQLARQMAKPCARGMQHAFGVLRYLAGTTEYGLVYTRNCTKLVGHSDASYAGDAERKSNAAYVFGLEGGSGGFNTISWASKRLHTICLSSHEAELAAASEAAKEAIALRAIFIETALWMNAQPVTIKIDNQATTKTIIKPSGQAATRHMDIRRKWIQQCAKDGLVAVEWCEGLQMLADGLTKALNGTMLASFAARVMGCRDDPLATKKEHKESKAQTGKTGQHCKEKEVASKE